MKVQKAGVAQAQFRELLEGLLEAGDKERLVSTLVDVFGQVSRENDALRMRVAQLTNRVYGRSSEKIDPNQLRLALEQLRADEFAKQDAGKAAGDPDEPAREKKRRPKRRYKPHQGRNPLPEHLPREERRHTLVEGERECECCKKTKGVIREEVVERLEFKPASFFVIRDVIEVYACTCGQSTPARAEPPPRAIEGGVPEPGLLAQVTIAKYKDSLPLNRQAKIYAREGVEISPNTMVDWIALVAWLLEPIARAIHEHAMRAWVVGSDDTGLRVLDRKHASGAKRGRIWVVLGDRFASYHYSPNWKHEHPAQFLKGVVGYLQTDGYKGYDSLCEGEGTAIRVGCWMHARRYFVKAFKAGEILAAQPIDIIQRLYLVERESKEKGEEHEARQVRRKEHSAPLIKELETWLEKHKDVHPPKTPLAKAITYLENQWGPLCVFLSDGHIQLDNGAVERALRNIAVGRRNWLFAGSDAGAERAAVIYTVIETAVLHGLDPFTYLRDVIDKIGADWPNRRLDELLPARWIDLHAPPDARPAVAVAAPEPGTTLVGTSG